MRPCAGLSAYIGDRTAQGAAQRVMADAANAWRASAPVAAIAADLRSYGDGSDLETGSQLADLVASFPAALDFTGSFLSAMAAAMDRQPLGHPCFWHSLEGGYTALHMLHSGRATLSLVVAEGDPGQTRPVPVSASFSATERREVVLAGKATGEVMTLTGSGPFALRREDRSFEQGQVLNLPAWSARSFGSIESPLACLRLSRRPDPMPVTRQIRLSDGALIHEAAGDPRDTRHELMAALLGQMGTADAAPVLGDVARRAGADATRWQALRSALAIDTATGFAVLLELAENPDDPLARDAAMLRDQLIRAYPVLAGLEAA